MLWLMDSFDHYETEDQVSQKYTQVYNVPGATAGPVLASGIGRNGTYGMRFSCDTAGFMVTKPAGIVIPTTRTVGLCGFRFKAYGAGSWANVFDPNGDFYPWAGIASLYPRTRNFICQFRHHGHGQVTMTVRENGQLLFYYGQRSNDSGFGLSAQTIKALQWGRWYHIQLRFLSHAVSGTLELRVNDDVWLMASGITTSYPGGIDGPVDAGWDEFIFGKNSADSSNAFGRYSGSSHWVFDDLWVADDNPSLLHNDVITFWGDKRIDWRPVVSDGVYTEWTPSVGSDHYALVDEHPHTEDVDYVQASGVGVRDSYGVANALVPGYNIDAMQIIGAIKRVQGGSSKTRLGFRSDGVDYLGSGIGNTGEYSFQREIFTRVPSSGYPAITDLLYNDIEALIKKDL